MEHQDKSAHETADTSFHIGITMAGAASAGCYTAGAMDYLFEILDLWEKAKGPSGKLPLGWDERLLSLVPQHNVIIDAMGGTSAGGMTTIMAAIYGLRGEIAPVSDPGSPESPKDNVMYDSWVLMGDSSGGPSLLSKLFDTSDLDKQGKIQSLLNSDFIDSICDAAFLDEGKPKAKFPFLSDRLEVVLSHTMLRSVPLGVDFNTPASKIRRSGKDVDHSSFEHFTVSHFKLDYDEQRHKDKYLPLKPFDDAAATTIKLATMATGAFPVGLKFRQFFNNELSSMYMKNMTGKIAFNRLSDIPTTEVPQLVFPDQFPDPFPFVSVDGGAINNEPFGEVLGILKERYGKKEPTEHFKYGLIMIDPFPDVPVNTSFKQPDDLFEVVPAIIGALWNQSKVKRAELLDSYTSEYYKGQIFPVRWDTHQKNQPHPIACGAAMAFGGFLDINFRHHDFFLGRDNARNFYRTFFSFPCKVKTEIINGQEKPVKPYQILEAHPIHRAWSSEMIDKFKRPSNKADTVLLPIIPDLHILKEYQDSGKERNPLKKSVPDWPKYDAKKLFALKGKMEDRFERMLELSYSTLTSPKPAPSYPATTRLLERHYRTTWYTRLKEWAGFHVLRILFRWNKRKLASRITKASIEWLLKDLEDKKLLLD